jgi:hypothetical protein
VTPFFGSVRLLSTIGSSSWTNCNERLNFSEKDVIDFAAMVEDNGFRGMSHITCAVGGC